MKLLPGKGILPGVDRQRIISVCTMGTFFFKTNIINILHNLAVIFPQSENVLLWWQAQFFETFLIGLVKLKILFSNGRNLAKESLEQKVRQQVTNNQPQPCIHLGWVTGTQLEISTVEVEISAAKDISWNIFPTDFKFLPTNFKFLLKKFQFQWRQQTFQPQKLKFQRWSFGSSFTRGTRHLLTCGRWAKCGRTSAPRRPRWAWPARRAGPPPRCGTGRPGGRGLAGGRRTPAGGCCNGRDYLGWAGNYSNSNRFISLWYMIVYRVLFRLDMHIIN